MNKLRSGSSANKYSSNLFLFYGILLIIILLFIGLIFVNQQRNSTSYPRNKSAVSTSETVSVDKKSADELTGKSGIPSRVLRTLKLIDAGKWPAAANARGTRGGDRWFNLEKRLPTYDSQGKKIKYREWDVNPHRSGHTRDAERIITANNGAAWYTLDHYRTFQRIR